MKNQIISQFVLLKVLPLSPPSLPNNYSKTKNDIVTLCPSFNPCFHYFIYMFFF